MNTKIADGTKTARGIKKPLEQAERSTEMNKKYLKNIDFETELNLADLVSYQEGQVVSRTLAQNKAVSVTLFAFDAGEEISSHESTGDAMVTALDGIAQITIGGVVHMLEKGKTIVMPARIPHAVAAVERFKMLLLVVFPS